MRTAFWFCALMGCGAVVLALFVSQRVLADAAIAPNDQALQLVRRALLAEADGKPDDRAKFLRQALSIAPDYAPAHWQAGEIRTDNQWASIDDAAKHDAHSAKLDEYRKLRDQAGETVEDQLNLARWCEKAGLKEQQRAHLTFALELQPNNKEAISKLGLVGFQHHLVPAAQLDEIKTRMKESTAVSKVWKDRVDAWRQQLKDHPDDPEVLKQIRAVRDPAAIYALSRGLAQSGKEACLAVVDALATMPQQASTDVLIRAALFSSYQPIREQAIYALKSRPVFDYVPLLIAGLKSPIRVEYEVLNFDAFNFTHQLKLFREAYDHEDVVVNYSSTTNTSPVIPVGNGPLTTPPPPDTSSIRTAAAAAFQRQQAQAMMNKVQQMNDQSEASNAMLIDLLSATTGEQLGDDPEAWWDYWYDYNEYYRPSEPPVNYKSNDSNNYSVSPRFQYFHNPPPPPYTGPPRRISCFVAGTPVWTVSGPMQIEKIKIGELVLAQNLETGELMYKPVLDTTIRPTCPVIDIRFGESLIRASRGHPFWVAGTGWQMAKELKTGQWLHTAHGPVQIESVEPSDEAVCYNLVVADFHDYFVSADKVLVHDNLLRGPTLSTVPGLAEVK